MKAKDYYILMENIFYENVDNIKDALKENPELEKEIKNIITDKKNININNFVKVLNSKNFKNFFKKFKNNDKFKTFSKKHETESKNIINKKDSMINESAVLFFSIQGILFLVFVLLNAFEININIAYVLEKLSNYIRKK